MSLTTVKAGSLSIVTSDFYAKPMSFLEGDARLGYEPELARLVCQQLALTPVWHNLAMENFYTSLTTGDYDLVWFNQAITPERQTKALFTRPYGLFDEAVLVRQGSPIQSAADLAGLKVGGLADSTNLELARSFGNAEIIAFPGSDRVLPEMLAALRQGEIEALIDDELVLLVAAEEDPSLQLAFSVETRVPFAIAARPSDSELVNAINQILEGLIADGSMAALWQTWIPRKTFPF
ncbi:MAG: ABC transporter substrate-binding protein [Aphanocapsa sp. GSE-SYN-MK-11-07L]|jgi:ABC-type amino acid transport substrate-binding protein|nr:ABC transporter substrate-binding protein [Aphanocapsa sp. GSE-SYN-MK-11-07L]